jgi:ribosomal protein L12E/L44/L45/RPP1/RPP2
MKKLGAIAVAVIGVALVSIAIAAPANAAAAGIQKAAKQECKQERRTDTRECVNQYGGKGKQALKRCIIDEIR